jgi:hypothetical protein
VLWVISNSFRRRSQVVGASLSICLHALVIAGITSAVRPVPRTAALAGDQTTVTIDLVSGGPAPTYGPPALPPVAHRAGNSGGIVRRRPLMVVAPRARAPQEETVLTGVPPGAVDPSPAPAERWVPPGEARDLRLYDVYPVMPQSVWARAARYAVNLAICVSNDGAVSDVTVRGGGGPGVETVLRDAIQTWRYRPRMVAGVAVPFCHQMNIQYSRY